MRLILKKVIPLSSYGPKPQRLYFEVSILNERRMVLDTCHLCESGSKVLRPLDSWAAGHLALFKWPVRTTSGTWLHAIVPVPVEAKYCVV